MLDDIVREQLRSEILQIEDLFVEFSELLDKSASTEPSMVERTALGSVLHSFYTGLEGIFLTVAKRVDEQVPSGNRWHRDLLDQVDAATDLRPSLNQGILAGIPRLPAFLPASLCLRAVLGRDARSGEWVGIYVGTDQD